MKALCYWINFQSEKYQVQCTAFDSAYSAGRWSFCSFLLGPDSMVCWGILLLAVAQCPSGCHWPMPLGIEFASRKLPVAGSDIQLDLKVCRHVMLTCQVRTMRLRCHLLSLVKLYTCPRRTNVGISVNHDYCQSDKSPGYFEIDLDIKMLYLNIGDISNQKMMFGLAESLAEQASLLALLPPGSSPRSVERRGILSFKQT